MGNAQTNFTAGSMIRSSAPKVARAPKAADPDTVPEGTTTEVLEWVGDDAARAKEALEAERSNGDHDPRVTLVEPLEQIVEPKKAPAKKAPAKKAPVKKTAARKAATK